MDILCKYFTFQFVDSLGKKAELFVEVILLISRVIRPVVACVCCAPCNAVIVACVRCAPCDVVYASCSAVRDWFIRRVSPRVIGLFVVFRCA